MHRLCAHLEGVQQYSRSGLSAAGCALEQMIEFLLHTLSGHSQQRVAQWWHAGGRAMVTLGQHWGRALVLCSCLYDPHAPCGRRRIVTGAACFRVHLQCHSQHVWHTCPLDYTSPVWSRCNPAGSDHRMLIFVSLLGCPLVGSGLLGCSCPPGLSV